jgi:hypothetical protein
VLKPGSRRSRHLAERSRRRRNKRWLLLAVVALAVLGVAAAAVWFLSRGGDGGTSAALTTVSTAASQTVAPASGRRSYVLRVSGGGGEVVVDAVIITGDASTAVVGFPAVTLVEGAAGFEPLDELLAKADPSAGLAGLERLLGDRPVGVAEVTWAAVRSSLASAGVPGDRPENLGTAQPKAADTVAKALAALAAASAGDTGRKALAGLAITGEADAVKAALSTLPAGIDVAAVVPGKTVKGNGYAYYEPDRAAIRRLLGETPPEQAISVEVQNGSGEVGIAERVVKVIAPLGYTMLPAGNADDFPDVATTRIFAAPDTLAEADRLRGVLRHGTVVRQESLPAGRILVVIGKDLPAASLPAPGA